MINAHKIKKDICEIGRRLYNKGFAAANDGNITVKLSDNEFLCTPTMHSKGFLVPDDIGTQVVIDGNREDRPMDRGRGPRQAGPPRFAEADMPRLDVMPERTDRPRRARASMPEALDPPLESIPDELSGPMERRTMLAAGALEDAFFERLGRR